MSPFFRRRRREPEPEHDAPPPGPDEGTLFDVRRAQVSDDHPSWHGSWERLSDRVHGFLRRRFGRTRLPHDIEFDDLFSSVLACMLKDLPGLRVQTREEFWAWVKKVATHQIVSFWRRHDAQKRGGGRVVEQQVDDRERDLVEAYRDPNAHTASVIMRVQELEQAELDCIARVADEEGRKLYVLRRRLGLSYDEISRQLGRGSSTEATRMVFQRLKEKVQDCLRHKLDGYELAVRP